MEIKDINLENQEVENNVTDSQNAEIEAEQTNEADTVADESFEAADKVAEECRAWQDKYTRLSAEFDNYRKRTLKEKMELVATGGQDVLKDVIGIVDDLQRALEHMTTEKDGVQLILNKFMDVLKRKGVKPIDAMGQDLDVDYHEAIAKIPAPSADQKGKVVDVVQQGYMIGDKVLRFAKVVVGE